MNRYNNTGQRENSGGFTYEHIQRRLQSPRIKNRWPYLINMEDAELVIYHNNGIYELTEKGRRVLARRQTR